ncbi:cytochrome c oxidase subunit 8B, mitochondrial-like [Bufo gargarizans]|uniref:cytochrome c oxidase subunit 8B, mitochondrial-like n=1 Tax=Bufo gargarizans TaxID=30331 RepID=UPI001CF44674|nr:cytochrome c oxidase subunit 8B, mitochondrial-like [Bufo gargarizans]
MYVLHTASRVNLCIATHQLETRTSKTTPFSKPRELQSGLYTCLRRREQNLHPQSAAMPLFTRALGLLRQARSPQVMNKAWSSKKAQTHEISAGEQAIGLGVLFSVFLIPSGWILSHLEDYKKRPE